MIDLLLLGNEMLQKQLCIFDVRLYCLQVPAELINSFSLEGKTWVLAQFSPLSGFSVKQSDFFSADMVVVVEGSSSGAYAE